MPDPNQADVPPSRNDSHPTDDDAEPSRRWLLGSAAGLVGAAGLGAVLWAASRNKPTPPNAPVAGAVFWQRIGREAATFQAGGPVRAVAVSPDLRWLAAASEPAGVSVWDLHTGEPVAGLRGVKPGQGTRTLAFSRDGQTLLAGLRGGVASLAPATGEVGETPLAIPADDAVSCLAFTPSGASLVYGLQAPDRPDGLTARLFLVGVPGFAPVGDTPGYPAGSFVGLTFAPHRPEVFTLGQDGTLRAFAVPKFGVLRSAGPAKPGEGSPAFALATTPSAGPENRPAGRFVAVADAGGLVFRRSDDWAKPVPFWPVEKAQPRSVGWSPSSRYLAAGTADGRVLFRDNYTEKVTELAGHTAPVGALAFFPVGTLLMTGSDDGTVRLVNYAYVE